MALDDSADATHNHDRVHTVTKLGCSIARSMGSLAVRSIRVLAPLRWAIALIPPPRSPL